VESKGARWSGVFFLYEKGPPFPPLPQFPAGESGASPGGFVLWVEHPPPHFSCCLWVNFVWPFLFPQFLSSNVLTLVGAGGFFFSCTPLEKFFFFFVKLSLGSGFLPQTWGGANAREPKKQGTLKTDWGPFSRLFPTPLFPPRVFCNSSSPFPKNPQTLS